MSARGSLRGCPRRGCRRGRAAEPSRRGRQGRRPEHCPARASARTPRAALRIGGVLTPPLMFAALRGIKRDDDFGSNAIAQHVLAHLLKSGRYDRQPTRAQTPVPATTGRLSPAHRSPVARLAGDGKRGRLASDGGVAPGCVRAQAGGGRGGTRTGRARTRGHVRQHDVGRRHRRLLQTGRATPDMCHDAVGRLATAAQQLDQVTPEMEATAARESIRWHDIGAG